MPASRVPYGNSKGNGSFGTYPHNFEHGKPGEPVAGSGSKDK